MPMPMPMPMLKKKNAQNNYPCCEKKNLCIFQTVCKNSAPCLASYPPVNGNIHGILLQLPPVLHPPQAPLSWKPATWWKPRPGWKRYFQVSIHSMGGVGTFYCRGDGRWLDQTENPVSRPLFFFLLLGWAWGSSAGSAPHQRQQLLRAAHCTTLIPRCSHTLPYQCP